MNSIQTYINILIKNKSNICIHDFIMEIKTQFYPNINMILYNDLLQYIGEEEEYRIDARFYYKYSKINVEGYEFNLDTCDPDRNIGRTLKRSLMQEDIDYMYTYVEDISGMKCNQRYMMKPESFYRLLMDIPDCYRSARQTYSEYHVFLMKAIKYYNNLQIGILKLKEEEQMSKLCKINVQTDLVGKIDKLQLMIERQTDMIEKQSEEIESQSDEIKELLMYAEQTIDNLYEVQDDLYENKEHLLINKSYLVEINNNIDNNKIINSTIETIILP